MVEQLHSAHHPHEIDNEYYLKNQEIITLGNKTSLLKNKKDRSLGSIYTPPDFVQFLTSWAIQKHDQRILDVGVGEGVFTFSSYHRLLKLGARPSQALQQLYGAEIDAATYQRFSLLSTSQGIHFPNLQNVNFFDADFPQMDAIVGNPPYVRRNYINNIDEIRKKVLMKNLLIKETDIHRLTDLYIYFLLQALPLLKVGGRLAVITADAWLNALYGKVLKKYLLSHFHIENLISLDRRIFDDAEVKPILILATKKEEDIGKTIQFIRVKNKFPLSNLFTSDNNVKHQSSDLVSISMKSCDLQASHPWGIYFKAPQLYEDLASHELMTPMSNIAVTKIGVQTLAKEFFVLSLNETVSSCIEARFLEPLAQSLRYFDTPVISSDCPSPWFLFFCSENKEALQGTYALEYIHKGENAHVQVRGKGTTVVGYHNKERIKRSHRKHWYDLKTLIESRGRAPILIPRLIYHKYQVLWNQARFVPGELFIEFFPNASYDLEIYLAVLNSTVSEVLLRAQAQVYGGGTYNISPGAIKRLPTINIELLTEHQRTQLKQSYTYYLQDKEHDRTIIDDVVYSILDMDRKKRLQMKTVLEDLLQLASATKNL